MSSGGIGGDIISGLETVGGAAATAMGAPAIGIPLITQGLSGFMGGPSGTAAGTGQTPQLAGQVGQALGNLTAGGIPQSQAPTTSLAALNQLAPVAQLAMNRFGMGAGQQPQLAPQAPPIGPGTPVQPQAGGIGQGIQQLSQPTQPIIGGASAGNLMNPQGQLNPTSLQQIIAMLQGGGGPTV